jgi:CheY-like chemotaxis protein
MNTPRESITILIADDDEDDILLTRQALVASRLSNELRVVRDGEELMRYLLHEGEYRNLESSPRPGVILLDLNMPKKNGREAIAEIKSIPSLRQIPILILTTSRAEQDITEMYDLGASSYIAKPVGFQSLVSVMQQLGKYWFEIVELP